MDQSEHETSDEIWKIAPILCFLTAFVVWYTTHGILNAPFFWTLLMGVSTLGLHRSGQGQRAMLKALSKDVSERETELNLWKEAVDECLQRDEQRKRIRQGTETDDHLSIFGRELAENPELASWTHELESKYGPSFPSTEQDIFALEQVDKRLQTAWKRRCSAHDYWLRSYSSWVRCTTN